MKCMVGIPTLRPLVSLSTIESTSLEAWSRTSSSKSRYPPDFLPLTIALRENSKRKSILLPLSLSTSLPNRHGITSLRTHQTRTRRFRLHPSRHHRRDQRIPHHLDTT